ncbi:unnamed protein product [Dovyalis caffra]|uniref:Uncharacterized protein n=1 Tax=Dovyalis caffra TaxID=77055 RepID=A0AAV1SBK5_9ROSI|nr:unnamed protein product [Dovyalis caffra]
MAGNSNSKHESNPTPVNHLTNLIDGNVTKMVQLPRWLVVGNGSLDQLQYWGQPIYVARDIGCFLASWSNPQREKHMKRVASTFATDELAGYWVHLPQTSGFGAGNDGDKSQWNHANLVKETLREQEWDNQTTSRKSS